jgi:hypothetical protein
LNGKYRIVKPTEAACMPAPEAVPSCLSEDEGWLQAGTAIIEKNVTMTMSVTSGSLLQNPQGFM